MRGAKEGEGEAVAQLDSPHLFLPDIWEHHARSFPEREAVVCGHRRVSWREFNQGLNRVANGLIDVGLRRGDKVAVVMHNSVEMLTIMYGVIKAGACVVPISALLSPEQILGMIEDSDSVMLFADRETQELLLPIQDLMTAMYNDGLFAFGFIADGWRNFSQWYSEQSDAEPGVDYALEDPINIIYSSGTTGLPKGIVQAHRVRQHFSFSNAIEMRFTRNARALTTTSLYSNGTWLMILPVLFVGGTLHILEAFSPAAFLETVEREKITHTFMVPTQYIVTLEHQSFDSYDLSSLEVMLSAGSPLRVDTKKEVMERMGPGMYELYGYTEGAATMIKPEDAEAKWGSVGTPVLGFDIRIIDEAGNELPFGEVGEIVSYGPGIMSEYHKRLEATADVIWRDVRGRTFLRSGDIGRFDEDGFLYILDRKKDMIISGGFNLFPADIEQIVGGHPDVSDVTVIGIPHEKWGETPLALIIPKPGADFDADAVKTWANARLGKTQRLADIELREDFPRNALGKVIKRVLREPYWEKVE